MQDLLHDVFGWVCGQGLAHTWSPGGELLPVCQRCTGVYVGAFVAAVLHLTWRPAPTTPWLWLNGAFLLFIMPSGFYWIPQNPELRCASGILFGFGLVSYLSLTWPRKIGTGGIMGHTNEPAARALRWAADRSQGDRCHHGMVEVLALRELRRPAQRRAAGIFRVTEVWPRVRCLLRRQTWSQRDHCHQRNSRASVFAIITTLPAALVLTPLLAEGGGTMGSGVLIFACVAGALALAGLVLANLFFSLRWLARPNCNDAVETRF